MSELDQIIHEERGNDYGDFGEMSRTAQYLKIRLKRSELNPAEREALDVICTKLARIIHGDPRKQFDSWTDIAGYAKLARASRARINPTHGNFDVTKDNL